MSDFCVNFNFQKNAISEPLSPSKVVKPHTDIYQNKDIGIDFCLFGRVNLADKTFMTDTKIIN